jgi:hypothetical protein
MIANDLHGQFTGPAEVRLVRILPGPIERVWDYLTDSEKRGRWFAGGPMEPRRVASSRFTSGTRISHPTRRRRRSIRSITTPATAWTESSPAGNPPGFLP